MKKLSSQKIYLFKAILEWINDNELTPHILVDANIPLVQVPEEFIMDGRIVLNISEAAVREFQLDAVWLSFFTRFSGKECFIQVPLGSIVALYAKENGEGLGFDVYPISLEELENYSKPTDKSVHESAEKKALQLTVAVTNDAPKVKKKAKSSVKKLSNEKKEKIASQSEESLEPKRTKKSNTKVPKKGSKIESDKIISLEIVKKKDE